MIYYIPVWVAITVLVFFAILLIYGVIWIAKHNKKENERQQLNKDIHNMGKSGSDSV